MTVLHAENIRVTRSGRTILDGVSLTARPGEVLGIVGPNGAGKSTLLRVMAGLLAPTAGAVTLDGRARDRRTRRDWARHIAYLPQHPECHPSMSVGRVVALGRLPHLASWQRPGAADRVAVERAMDDMDVADLSDRPAGSLSGGEHARVMLARALAAEAPLLLADEPVADLDPYHTLDVMAHLARLARAGRGVAVVLHDLTLAARCCTRLVLMHHGAVVAEGAPPETLSPENLAAIYRITALSGSEDGERFLLPWSRLPDRPEAP